LLNQPTTQSCAARSIFQPLLVFKWQALISVAIKFIVKCDAGTHRGLKLDNLFTDKPVTGLKGIHTWFSGVMVRMLDLRPRSCGFDSRSGRYQVVATLMSDCLRTGKPSRYITNYQGQLSLPSLQGR